MGYTIMYGRQFVKTSRGIIPLALCGSNNCTEFINGREVRERSWTVYAVNKVEYSVAEYIAESQGFCGKGNNEHFNQNGKWVDDAAWMRWINNGIKQAKTIEEIRETLPNQSLMCYLSVWKKREYRKENEWGNQTEMRCFCETTKQLEEWLDKAYERKNNINREEDCIHICLSFMGREPLRFQSVKEPNRKVIAKRKNYYICELDETGWRKSTTDIKQAIVFDSVEDAKQALPAWKYDKIRFIKAENKEIEKAYRILVKSKSYSGGYYVWKLTRGGLKGCHEPEDGMRFVSEQAAQRYIDKTLRPRFMNITEYNIIRIA